MSKVGELNVWTNGRAIRKYAGQDHRSDIRVRTMRNGWFKARAVLYVDCECTCSNEDGCPCDQNKERWED